MAPPPPRGRPRPDDDGRRRRTGGHGRPARDDERRGSGQGRPARDGTPTGRGRGREDKPRRRPEEDDAAARARRQQRDRQEARAPKRWGGVARRGTRELAEPEPGSASEAWRDAAGRHRGRREEWQPERWQRDDAPRGRQRKTAPPPPEPAPAQGPRRRPPRKAPQAVVSELQKVAGPKKAPRLEERLMDAAQTYERERYSDARRMIARLAEEAPAAAAVRELHGLTLYRLGKWRDAAKELEAYRALTGSVEQHPVLADCYRALKRYRKVNELWDELRSISPGADLVAEGRIVAAGALADQGRIDDAIALLERGRLTSKRPRDHHLRLWYALADLYERAGEIPRARELFRRVTDHERDFADAAERLSGLG